MIIYDILLIRQYQVSTTVVFYIVSCLYYAYADVFVNRHLA